MAKAHARRKPAARSSGKHEKADREAPDREALAEKWDVDVSVIDAAVKALGDDPDDIRRYILRRRRESVRAW